MKTTAVTLSAPQPLRLHLPDFRRVNLTLVGCGGTGSHLASGLVSIAQALAGRSIATDLLFIDPDVVEPQNVGRQLFSQADVGRYKADVLASRLNAAFATTAGFAPRTIDAQDTFCVDGCLSVVIGAVDNASARALINRRVCGNPSRALWWLDCGNDHHSGQVALGNCGKSDLKRSVALGMVDRLPAPSVVYPDLVRGKRPSARRPRARSCAELTASGEQGLMVNRMVASWALALLYDFLVAREVRYFALAFDLAWGGARAYTLDMPTLAEVTGLKASELQQARRNS